MVQNNGWTADTNWYLSGLPKYSIYISPVPILGPISSTVYEIMIEMLWKLFLRSIILVNQSGHNIMSWLGSIFHITGPLWGESTSHWWFPNTKGQYHGALIFSLIYACTSGWTNSEVAGDFSRDICVKSLWQICTWHSSRTVMSYTKLWPDLIVFSYKTEHIYKIWMIAICAVCPRPPLCFLIHDKKDVSGCIECRETLHM